MRAIDHRKELGLAIRRARQGKKLSQEGLAFECGLHRTYVGSVERGERNLSIDNIVRIANTLGIRPSDLFQRAGL